MTSSFGTELIASALSAIEMAEAPLLSWGDTEVAFDTADLCDIISEAAPGVDAEAVVDELVYGEFLYEVPYLTGGRMYRTRSAETLRLLTRVRQLFPKRNDPTGNWRSGPRLVRDFRYAIRPRRVPTRSHTRSEVLEALAANCSPRELAAVEAMLSDDFRLRGFQFRAAEQILKDLRAPKSRGVVVTAGTGGGKTLAFYLPALAKIASMADSKSWVKALAVYPRNELLRDQLAGVYRSARDLDALQAERGLRPVRVGTLFQETPYRRDADFERIGWKRRSGGYECPMMTCPACDTGALIWRDADRAAKRDALRCTGCDHVVDDSTFAITRRSMQDNPPDIMFCSAEMVHRTTSDLPYASLIGVHAIRPPRFLLLDEIHTYEGITGAQTAQVLRRWRHLVEGPVEVVGLSATLPNAQAFLSELVGLDEWRVTTVGVHEHELEDIGSEYVVALRHDPTTRTATLSTTIQALMCLARCLDPMDDPSPVSDGVYGRRVFAFTDRLDVVNRLYADMADAEGYTNTGRAKSGKGSLAALRNPHVLTGPEQSERQKDGQSWDLPSFLGHSLDTGPGIRVGRVSSQDPGIDDVSSIVAATASLEVGFDDDRAGAVLQHGAPSDMGRFIQRKGRAGRPEDMRPWTVVVLSDYGKDRRSYQAWDALVDPQAPPKSIPVRNRYVLRMHAVHATLDWIGLKLRGRDGRLRFDLAAPSDQAWHERWAARIEPVQELLEALLEDPALQAHLQRYIGEALQVSHDEAGVLLWHPPRPILLGAVPTLIRRIETDWRDIRRGARQDLHVPQVPLPDFVSRTLFESLESPDVDVEWPARFSDDNDVSTISLETLLREFAPGNASRRFGYKSQRAVHWVPVAHDERGDYVDVDRFFVDAEEVGTLDVDGPSRVRLLRPRRVVLEDVPEDYGDQARADGVWSTGLASLGTPYSLTLAGSEVATAISRVDLYLHVDGSGVDIQRGLHTTECEVPESPGRTRRSEARFFVGDERVALGTRFSVDAAAVQVEIPSDLVALARADEALERATRSSWLVHCFQSDPRLTDHANRFQLEWVHDAVVATVARRVLEEGMSLDQALESSDGRGLILNGLDLILTPGTGGDPSSSESRLRGGLEELASIPDFVVAVADVASELAKPVDERMRDWLEDRFRTTVVSAVLEAAQLLAREHSSDDCVVDIDPHIVEGGLPPSWLVERSPGGAGFLEELRVLLEEEPRRFARVMRTLLLPGADDRANADLVRILATDHHADVWRCLENYRSARTPAERRSSLSELRRIMRRSRLSPLPETVAALITRVARPGSDSTSDEACRQLVSGWIDAERAVGVDLDVRIWTVLGSNLLAAQGVTLPAPPDAASQLDAVQSLLWPRGWRRESDRLRTWNPFEEHLPTFPSLVVHAMERSLPHVWIPSEEAEAKVFDRLKGSGSCRVAAAEGDERALAQFVVAMAATPIDVGGLLAFAHVSDISMSTAGHVASFELREALPV